MSCPASRSPNLVSITHHAANFEAITRHAKTLCHPLSRAKVRKDTKQQYDSLLGQATVKSCLKNEQHYFIQFRTRGVWTASKTFVVDLLICRIILGLLLFFWRKSAAKFSRVFIKLKTLIKHSFLLYFLKELLMNFWTMLNIFSRKQVTFWIIHTHWRVQTHLSSDAIFLWQAINSTLHCGWYLCKEPETMLHYYLFLTEITSFRKSSTQREKVFSYNIMSWLHSGTLADWFS